MKTERRNLRKDRGMEFMIEVRRNGAAERKSARSFSASPPRMRCSAIRSAAHLLFTRSLHLPVGFLSANLPALPQAVPRGSHQIAGVPTKGEYADAARLPSFQC
jgi:hypothetical protein